MTPPADRICQQNEQDPGRVAHTRQEAGSTDFLAIGPALRILQLDVEGLCSQAFHHPRHSRDTTSTSSAFKTLTLTPIVQAVFLLLDLISSATHFTPNMAVRCVREMKKYNREMGRAEILWSGW